MTGFHRSDAEDKRTKSELQTENQRLRDMLGRQVTNNYSVPQMHPVAFVQQQQNQGAADTTQYHEVVEGKSEERKHGINGGVIVPRQFMDPGPGGPADQTEELSHSSSEDRTISGSPRNPSKNKVVREGKRVGREESPESESQGWNPNKIRKLNPSKPAAIDQSAEATMREARVSVGARSEAPTISDGCQWRKYGQKMAKGNPLQFQRTPSQFPVHFSGQPQSFGSMPTPTLPAQVYSQELHNLSIFAGLQPSQDMWPSQLAHHAPQSHRPPHQPQQPQPSLTDTVSAAIAAITADPNFTTALAAAITADPNFTSALAAAITADPNFTAALAAGMSSIINGAHPNNNTNTTNSNNNTSNNNNTISINFSSHPSSAWVIQTTPRSIFPINFPFSEE